MAAEPPDPRARLLLDQLAWLVDIHRQARGASYRDVAAQSGVSRVTVHQLATGGKRDRFCVRTLVVLAAWAGYEVRLVPAGRPPGTEEERDARVVTLYAAGLSQVDAGAAVGVSKTTVRRILRRRGVQARPPGGAH